MEFSHQLHSKVRAYLITSTDHRRHDGEFSASGGAPTHWMFTLPQAPENHYDEVYPGIIMGDSHIVRDKKSMKALGITHIINCAEGDGSRQINTKASFYRDVGISYHGMKAIDVSTYNMMQHFKAAFAFLDKALAKNGKVYVHCFKGVSRSACIVIAYLMKKYEIHLFDAVQMIRKNRKIHPNDGFLRQLCILNHDLFGQL